MVSSSYKLQKALEFLQLPEDYSISDVIERMNVVIDVEVSNLNQRDPEAHRQLKLALRAARTLLDRDIYKRHYSPLARFLSTNADVFAADPRLLQQWRNAGIDYPEYVLVDEKDGVTIENDSSLESDGAQISAPELTPA